MSDYNNPNSYDKYGNPIPGEARPFNYEPVGSSGRAPYVLLGILILVGLVGGGLYFNGKHNGSNVASAPPAIERPLPPAASPTAPGGGLNTTPAPTTTPAPAGAPATTQQ